MKDTSMNTVLAWIMREYREHLGVSLADAAQGCNMSPARYRQMETARISVNFSQLCMWGEMMIKHAYPNTDISRLVSDPRMPIAMVSFTDTLSKKLAHNFGWTVTSHIPHQDDLRDLLDQYYVSHGYQRRMKSIARGFTKKNKDCWHNGNGANRITGNDSFYFVVSLTHRCSDMTLQGVNFG